MNSRSIFLICLAGGVLLTMLIVAIVKIQHPNSAILQAGTNSLNNSQNLGFAAVESTSLSKTNDSGESTNRPPGDLPDEFRALSKLPKDEAVKKIIELLDTKMDASTGQPFEVGLGGDLTQAPTLRVALLDKLIRLDRKAAADYARKILSTQDSPDEWAVCLRAVALGDSTAAGKALLRQKSREMLTRASWQSAPSTGFLEAFDVIVHTEDTAFVPSLTGMLNQNENRALAHAAYLTLDRLTIRQPAAVFSQLQQHPEFMSYREQTRANFFARADLRDTEQRRIIETYLLDPSLSTQELGVFSRIFPNANYMVSHNLLTKVVTPDGGALRIRDHAALRVVDEWLQDSRFESVRAALESTRQRLAGFVGNSQEQN